MASVFRQPVLVTFVDLDNTELAHTTDTELLPRVGENVRIAGVPYLVERVGYDLPRDVVERVWIMCRRA